MRVIYADILFAINLSVDYLLLFAAARLSGAKFERLRALFAAILGAGYSLTVLVEIPPPVMAAARLGVSVLMVLITFGKRSFFEVLKLLAVFYVCSFLFSGFMLLLNSALNSETFLVQNGTIYFELTAAETVVSAAAAFLIVELIRRILNRGKPEDVLAVKIDFCGKTAVLNAFMDTGNSLSDPFSGAPVAICRRELLEKIAPEGGFSKSAEENLRSGKIMRCIPFSSVAGKGIIQAFRPDKAVIMNKDGSFEAEEILIGISEFAPENSLLLGSNVVLKKI